jgi:hypothetical protein
MTPCYVRKAWQSLTTAERAEINEMDLMKKARALWVQDKDAFIGPRAIAIRDKEGIASLVTQEDAVWDELERHCLHLNRPPGGIADPPLAYHIAVAKANLEWVTKHEPAGFSDDSSVAAHILDTEQVTQLSLF